MKKQILLLLPLLALSAAVLLPAARAQTENSAPAVMTPDAAMPDAPAPIADSTAVVAAVPAQQQAAEAAMRPVSRIEQEINDQLAYLRPNIDVDTMKSLFYTVWEHDLVLDARRGLTTRAPGTDDGVAPEATRDIALGGIVYRSGEDWTIWLNNIRVQPDAIPAEVLNLKVHKTYVDLEWFDNNTNQVFPIRLRAHQRFNLDTRMFLPG